MLISYRLRCIAECVKKGNITADVGCDHGLTSIYLVKNGIVPRVFALDINKDPLEAAKDNISKYGMTKYIDTRISDGISALTEDDKVQTILISGMGGQLIKNILAELSARRDISGRVDQLVLSPQSDLHIVRHFLHDSGYAITYERMVRDGKKYYNIICAEPGEEEYSDETEYCYGRYFCLNEDSVFTEYINREIDKKISIITELKNKLYNSQNGAAGAIMEAIDKLQKEIDSISVYFKDKGEMNMEKVTVKINGKEKQYDPEIVIKDIADEYSSEYDCDIIMSFKDGKVCELGKKLGQCETLEFITTDSVIGHKTYVRGVSMMMLKALYKVYGRDHLEKVRIEAAIGQGYYCEISGVDLDKDDRLAEVEKLMHTYVERDIRFDKKSIHTDDAIRLFASYNMKDKEKLFRYRMASFVNIYSLDGFVDYYYGSMPYSTGILKYFSIERYKDGFVLVIPNSKKEDCDITFQDSPKFYTIIKESNDWGRSMNIDTVGALNDAIADGRFRDIVMIQEALHEKKIGDIAANIASDKDKKIVMIAGPSSSGKTTFSHRLSIQLSTLGLNPHPIPVDDYFLNREQTPLNEDGSYNFECLEALDVEQFNKDMNGLLAGERVELPCFNFVTGEREYKGRYKQLGKDDILVIEGIHGLNDQLSYALPRESKYKIYISALTQLNIDEHNRIPTTDGRLLRRIVRDARTRGNDASRTISMWPSVRNGEEQYIFPHQEDADAMFNSALIYELAVIKQYAEPLLFKVDRDSKEYVEAKRLLKFLDYFLGVSSENINYNSILREFIGGSIFPV